MTKANLEIFLPLPKTKHYGWEEKLKEYEEKIIRINQEKNSITFDSNDDENNFFSPDQTTHKIKH